MRTSPPSVSGFTLTELMLVVAVAGILAVIAIPSFTALTQSQRVKNASFEMYTLFNLARSEAIKRNANVTIAPVMAGGVLDRLEVTDGGGVVLYSKSAPKGVGITPVPSSIASVIYQRSGRTTASAAPSFQIDVQGVSTPTQYVRCITLGLSGMPSIRTGAC